MKYIKTAAAALTVGLALTAGPALAAVQTFESAHGTSKVNVVNDTEGIRHFTFNVKVADDGTVSGKAHLRNTSFSGDDGKPFMAKVDITCVNALPDGKTVIFGGVSQNNDANLDNEAAYFAVQDNGKNNDLISGLVSFDNDPGTTGRADLCKVSTLADTPLSFDAKVEVK